MPQGIEALTLRTRNAPPDPPWESIIPAEYLRVPAQLEQVDALFDDGRFFALLTALFKPGPGLCAGPGADLPAVDVGDAGLGITMISAMDTPGRCPGLGDMPGVSMVGIKVPGDAA